MSLAFWSLSTHRRVWVLAIPMILSNISVPLFGLVDTAVIGHLDHAYYLGGVAFGSMLMSLMIWLCNFLRMSTTGFVAQAMGSNDAQKQGNILVQGLWIALTTALLLILCEPFIVKLGIALSEPSAEVVLYTNAYISIRIWSLPFSLLSMLGLGWLLGRRQVKYAMYQVILTNLCNIVFDLLFVLVLDWGVEGAALASVVAELCGFMLVLFFVVTEAKRADIPFIWRVDRSLLWQMMSLNRDMFIRALCLQIALSFMTIEGARLGDNIVAANAILLNLTLLIAYLLDGLAYFAEVEVGQAFGKKSLQDVEQAVFLSFFWSAVVAVFLTLLFAFFGHTIIGWMTDIKPVLDTAHAYLIWIIILPLTTFTCFLFDGVFVGALQGKWMRRSMLFSTVCVFFPVWFACQDLGNTALWLAWHAFVIARGISMFVIYKVHKKNWLPA